LNLRAIRIYLFFALLSAVLLKSSPVACKREVKQWPDSVSRLGLLLPASNPLKGFDANLYAWHTASELMFAGSEWLDERTGLSGSKPGRFSFLLLSAYLNYAASYYSHEVAHQFLNREDFAFRVDITDWYPHMVPEFVFSENGVEFWGEEILKRYRAGDKKDYLLKALLTFEAGLYQEKLNARFAAMNSSLRKSTSVSAAFRFVNNGLSDFVYLLHGRNDRVNLEEDMGYLWYNYNDINGYVTTMMDMGILISSDDWLISSGLAFFASGQTWNSVRALYHYFMSGEKQLENLSFKAGERYETSLPNFYLFPTVRGLYLETECFVHSDEKGSGTFRFGLGTGLDSFGLNQTGPVDRLRVGGAYYSYRIGIPRFPLTVSPFCYFNFDRSMKHRGQSLGFELQTPSWRSFSLYARFEHNRNDIEEQLIKNKDEGMYILTALEINL